MAASPQWEKNVGTPQKFSDKHVRQTARPLLNVQSQRLTFKHLRTSPQTRFPHVLCMSSALTPSERALIWSRTSSESEMWEKRSFPDRKIAGFPPLRRCLGSPRLSADRTAGFSRICNRDVFLYYLGSAKYFVVKLGSLCYTTCKQNNLQSKSNLNALCAKYSHFIIKCVSWGSNPWPGRCTLFNTF